jgi:translation initiation factor IF-2
MSKKDLIDRLNQPTKDVRVRRAEPAPSPAAPASAAARSEGERTRITSTVVRRRASTDAEATGPTPASAAPAVVRRRPAGVEPEAPPAAASAVEAAPAEIVPPAIEPEVTVEAGPPTPDVSVEASEPAAAPVAVEAAADVETTRAAASEPTAPPALTPRAPRAAERAVVVNRGAPSTLPPIAPPSSRTPSRGVPVSAAPPKPAAPRGVGGVIPRGAAPAAPERRNPAEAPRKVEVVRRAAADRRPEQPAPAPEPVRAEPSPELGRRSVVVREADAAPTGAVVRRAADGSGNAWRGLGSAVVRPPPGYDPSNPEAFRAAQRAAAPPPSADSRGRRRADAGPAMSSAAGAFPSQPNTGGPGGDRGRRGRGEPDAMELAMRGRLRKRKKGAPPPPSVPAGPKSAAKRKIRIDGAVTVAELAHELSLKATILIKKLMELGTPATINQPLDLDTATLLAQEFDYEIENVAFDEGQFLQHVTIEEEDDKAIRRSPVVTIMGHVDHGKTTLLDAIRSAKVASGEAGGITQHIGAYQVEAKGQTITFLDTPGHAAFSTMRARGASITDIVVLVVAADDGVQPQTVEAISHARAAKVPIVVAVNKCDKPGANPDAIKQRLVEFDLQPEEWGGETLYAAISALKKQGIDELLDVILLQAEVLDLKANPERHAEGTVIEARVERGRGPVATVLVQQGTIKAGDHIVMGSVYGRIRSMTDFKGKVLKTAGPSTPVEIFGISGLPRTGDTLSVTANERNARTLAEHRAEQEREAALSKHRRRTADDLRRLATQEELKTLHVVVKADVQGSLEALKHAITQIKVGGCEVRILHDGVGTITETDVNLVAANDGLLLGFNVKIDPRARKVADEHGVKPELYDVIYHLLDRVTAAMTGMLEPVYEEELQGKVEVRALFNISKIGTIAGSYVLEGKVARSSKVRVLREGQEVWRGEVSGLKRFKDDVREVSAGYEFGLSLNGYDEVQVGDIVEAYAMVRVDPAKDASHAG